MSRNATSPFILIDDRRRDVAAGDLAEETVGHQCLTSTIDHAGDHLQVRSWTATTSSLSIVDTQATQSVGLRELRTPGQAIRPGPDRGRGPGPEGRGSSVEPVSPPRPTRSVARNSRTSGGSDSISDSGMYGRLAMTTSGCRPVTPRSKGRADPVESGLPPRGARRSVWRPSSASAEMSTAVTWHSGISRATH